MLSTLLRPFFIRSRGPRNFLLDLWHEVNANMERLYVIDQRQFITSPFALDAWENAKHYSGAVLPPVLHDYASALEDFNRAFADMKAFERYYSSSQENRTRTNAEILHAKQESLEDRIRDIQAHALFAHKMLRSMLSQK